MYRVKNVSVTRVHPRLGSRGLELLSLAEVSGEGDHLAVVGVLEPLEDDGGVETTRVREHDLRVSSHPGRSGRAPASVFTIQRVLLRLHSVSRAMATDPRRSGFHAPGFRRWTRRRTQPRAPTDGKCRVRRAGTKGNDGRDGRPFQDHARNVFERKGSSAAGIGVGRLRKLSSVNDD